jgi:hypothetical protein
MRENQERGRECGKNIKLKAKKMMREEDEKEERIRVLLQNVYIIQKHVYIYKVK